MGQSHPSNRRTDFGAPASTWNVTRVIIVALASVALMIIALAAGTLLIIRDLDRARPNSTAVAPPTNPAAVQPTPAPIDVTSPFDDVFPEGRPAYTTRQLEQWVPEIRAMVEAAAGRKFKSQPTVKIASRSEVRQMMGVEDTRSGGFLDQLPDEFEATPVIALGLYDPADDIVYMLPGNLLPMMGLDNVERSMAEPLAKLVLAHELAHALQDQHLDLTHMDATVANVEQEQALRATIEGHASLIEHFVAARLGLVYRPDDVSERLSGAALTPKDPRLDSLLECRHILGELYYRKGRDFFEHNFDRGGHEQVWRILSDPPKDTAVFLNPARYWRPGQGLDEADAVLADLGAFVGPDRWLEENFSLGSFTLRVMYRMLGDRVADQFVAGIQWAQALALSTGDRAKFATATVYWLRKSVDSAAFVRTMERTPCAWLELIDQGAHSPIAEPYVSPMKGFNAKSAREMRFETTLNDGAVRPVRVIRVARGQRVLEIGAVGIDLTDQRLIELANELFRRCDQATGTDDMASPSK